MIKFVLNVVILPVTAAKLVACTVLPVMTLPLIVLATARLSITKVAKVAVPLTVRLFNVDVPETVRPVATTRLPPTVPPVSVR